MTGGDGDHCLVVVAIDGSGDRIIQRVTMILDRGEDSLLKWFVVTRSR